MPTHLRALVVILVLASAVLWLARRYTTESAIAPEDFKRRALVWFALTVLAFVARYYWIFALLTVPLLYLAAKKDANPLAFCFFVLFAIPPFPVSVSIMGNLGKLLVVDHLRWVSIAVLLPAFLALRRRPGAEPFGRATVDKAFLAYIVLLLALQTTATTMTNLLRMSLGVFLDMFLPYYVASRALRDVRAFRDALMSLVVAALLMSVIAVFEVMRGWLMYHGLDVALGRPPWGMGNYLAREGGFTRAIATAGHPIALGYLLSVAMAMLVFLRPAISDRRIWLLAWFTVGAGLIAAMSRGPWVGAAVMLLLLLITGPGISAKLVRAGVASLLLLPLAIMTKQGQAVIDYLPWVGTAESQNVEFRERLFDVSVGVLMNFPVFGALDFIDHPDMEQMRGGDGIIDIVNTYLLVALSSGFVGLALFVAPFFLVGIGIVRALYRLENKQSDEHLLGRALLAAMVGILVTIGTVSPVGAIAMVYIFVIGLGAGYLLMLKAAQARSARSSSAASAASGMRRNAGAAT